MKSLPSRSSFYNNFYAVESSSVYNADIDSRDGVDFSTTRGVSLSLANSYTNSSYAKVNEYSINHSVLKTIYFVKDQRSDYRENFSHSTFLEDMIIKNSDIDVTLQISPKNILLENSDLYLIINDDDEKPGHINVLMTKDSSFLFESLNGFDLTFEYNSSKRIDKFSLLTEKLSFHSNELKTMIEIYRELYEIKEFIFSEYPSLRKYHNFACDNSQFVYDFLESNQRLSFKVLDNFIKTNFFEIYGVAKNLENKSNKEGIHINELGDKALQTIKEFIGSSIYTEFLYESTDSFNLADYNQNLICCEIL